MSIRVEHIRGTTAEVESVTPLVGELGYDTTKKEAHIGDGATAGGIRIPKKNISEILAPAQIAAQADNYSPSGMKHAAVLVITTDAARDITGLVPTTVTDATDGREITLYNAGSFNAVLKDQSASSTAANRFDLGGSDMTLQPKNSVTLRYRTTGALNRWEIAARTDGVTPADGSILARKLAASSMGAFVGMINGSIVPSVAGSALTIALKTLAGTDPSATDPVYVVFRSVTPATGDFTVLTVTAATSLVVSSGSSLGVAANNTAFKLWPVGFNDGGTFRLGVINCLSGKDIFPLAAWGIATSTAEGGAGGADLAHTFYTGAAVAAKAYIPLGYMTWETGLAAAGTWSAGPTRTQLFGHGVPLPGTSVQTVMSQTGAMTTGATAIPFDDTIPQNTEGDQYLSKAITPSSAANVLRIDAGIHAGSSAASMWNQAALFQDSVASALASAMGFQATATGIAPTTIHHEMLAGLTTQTTFKVRAGGTSGTTTFNGAGGLRYHGGSLSSYLKIEEIAT
jgi:hypothetical protein